MPEDWEDKYERAIKVIEKCLTGTYRDLSYNYDKMEMEDIGTFPYSEIQIRTMLQEFLKEEKK